ncbi:MAG: exo-alpha-sialidase [Balneolaceae bacterium]|nr:MAG: exo-alpha-sialidase [Balneolaceae bacterium]
MINFIFKYQRYIIAYLLLGTYFVLSSCKSNTGHIDNGDGRDIQHEIVYYEEGRFAAWPANGGMWIWDDEILVCFNVAEHVDRPGHTYDVSTSRNMFARSLDGGETWVIEDAYENGITGYAMDHRIGDKAVAPVDLEEAIDFHNPDFAFMFQRETNIRGPAHFYYTYDRGKSWQGPYNFPDMDPAGITNRTDYIIDGRHEMTAVLSIGHGRTGVARTKDGGITWEFLSYIGPDFTRSEELQGRNDYSLMPATVRLSSSDILTTIRHREGDERRVWITSYLSADNGATWIQLDDPVTDHVNSPPALVQLHDGRLALFYIFRRGGWNEPPGNIDGSTVCVRVSSDNGLTWGEEIVLRGDEGANYDVGYPRALLRPDGKVVITYYWNHALDDSKPPYRYIAATIWDPGS